jgi:hypothetical protein
MSIVKAELKDYKSSAADSDGGTISATQLPATELSANVSAGASVISVHDAGGFAVSDEIVIDDGTNKEKKIIQSIATNDITLTTTLVNGYSAGTSVSKKNALLPDVSAQQANDGLTVYRKFFRKNTNTSLTWAAVIVWLSKQFTNAAISAGFGLDHADDNAGAQGNMSAFSASAVVAAVSDGADTRVLTVVGEDGSGNRQTENITLNGTTEVVGTLTFSKVYNVSVGTLDAARTVTIKQGAGGTTRGTIGLNKKICWLWFGKMASGASIVNAEGGDIPTQATGIKAGNIAAASNVPVWVRLSVPTGASAIANNTAFMQIQGETA